MPTRLLCAALAALAMAVAAPAQAQGGQFQGAVTASKHEPAAAEGRHAADRQAQPQRQAEPQRHAAPRRQPEPARQGARPVDPHWPEPATGLSVFNRNLNPAVPDLTVRPGQDLFRASPNTYAPGHGRPPSVRARRGGGGVYLGYPYFAPRGYGAYYPSGVTQPGAIVPEPVSPSEPEGFLRLQVRPRSAEVWVDGAYAGTVDDFGGTTEHALRSGVHRVELQAAGFERVTFDVRVPDHDTITFRRDLERVPDRPATPPAPAPEIPHKTMYFIPRCYAGDMPPRADQLPAGCSVADVRTIP